MSKIRPKEVTLEDINFTKIYGKLKFLIVDDFESFRSSVRMMLSSFGATHIELASNAEEALAKCRHEWFDVVLCDFNFGPGKNGQQLLEELRVTKRLRHTHLFVMITAETARDVVMGAREYQPDAYIAKPVTRTVLEQRLNQLLTQQYQLKAINKEIDLENYPKAISLCQEKIASGSRYKSWCQQTLASLYSKVGDHHQAEGIYAQALKQRDLIWAKLGMGRVLNAQKNYHKAKRYFQDVIARNPNMIEAYDGLCDACKHLGEHHEAQLFLQQAVALSPRLVTRQKKLGDLCLANNDLEGACDAMRMAISYGENSIYHQPEPYLSLGRCLCDLSQGDLSASGKKRAQEGSHTLEQVNRHFSDDESACIIANLIDARLNLGQSHHERADDLMHKAQCMIDDNQLAPEVGLELAKTFFAFKQERKAIDLLVRLAAEHYDNAALLQRIENLMDEPEDLQTRLKAKDLNHAAIKCVERGELAEAIKFFSQALALTPKHAALNLNLIQVVVKHCKTTGDNQHLKLAQQALERLAHIPEQHHQYKRLMHFKDLVTQLNNSFVN